MSLTKSNIAVNRSPKKVTLTSVRDAGEQKTFQVFTNPSEFTESYTANYIEQQILGLTHQPYQYINTSNSEISLTFIVDKLYIQRRDNAIVDVDEFRRFLTAHCYPEGANFIGSKASAPPELILVWHSVITATVRLMSVTFKHTRFDTNGVSTYFEADCKFKRVHRKRIDFDTVRNSRSSNF